MFRAMDMKMHACFYTHHVQELEAFLRRAIQQLLGNGAQLQVAMLLELSVECFAQASQHGQSLGRADRGDNMTLLVSLWNR